ncbi:MAG TPA: GNAT family N-acetyltransferase [Candidatus Limiplasma sp.]|nr:GNAT family N-acetyltransferase [Candidatus Limiplasma sp.]
MDIRKLKPEDTQAGNIIDAISFVFPVPEEKEAADKRPFQSDRWGCFDDAGQLTATLFNHDLPIYFDGGIAPARGVGGVASDPVSRGNGHIRALIAQVLADDYRAGMLFSVLYPFSHPFYRKFGYELCFEGCKANFPTDMLKIFRTDDPPQARMIRPDNGLEALHPIYTAFAKQFNVAVARDARTWKRIKLGDPYKAEQYCYVLSRGGKDTGYAIFRFKPQDKPYVRTLCLTDYAFTDKAAFYDLMSFLYRYTAQAKDIEMFVPGNLPLSSLLKEISDIEISVFSSPMARAVCVEKILKAMRHPKADGTYSIYVEDSFLPENEGCYRVQYTQGGDVTVTRCEDAADLRVSVQSFAQLALGFLDLAQAAYKPDVQISGNETVLKQVFVQKPVFLWDFY